MDKICRSMSTFYRLPRLGHLNLRLGPTATTNISYAIGGETNKKSNSWNVLSVRQYNSNHRPPSSGLSGSKPVVGSHEEEESYQDIPHLTEILEREIQDETAELSQHPSTDKFPGFSVETNESEVKLFKKINNTNVTVRFSVSSSLTESPDPSEDVNSQSEQPSTKLVSMPEFQVQISKNNQTLELSCYFEEEGVDEETGEPQSPEPVFSVDELVLYQGEPKETEFAVSAEYFQEDLQMSLHNYLAEHGIHDAFAKNLVDFATSYEKKQYINLMKRLKSFVSK